MAKSESKTEKTPETKTFKIEAEIPGDLKDLCSHKSYSRVKCGGIYGIGVIGALFYFISNATGIVDGLIGVVKAFLWPAFLVHSLLGFLGL